MACQILQKYLDASWPLPGLSCLISFELMFSIPTLCEWMYGIISNPVSHVSYREQNWNPIPSCTGNHFLTEPYPLVGGSELCGGLQNPKSVWSSQETDFRNVGHEEQAYKNAAKTQFYGSGMPSSNSNLPVPAQSSANFSDDIFRTNEPLYNRLQVATGFQGNNLASQFSADSARSLGLQDLSYPDGLQ